jgi:hypothetical protein
VKKTTTVRMKLLRTGKEALMKSAQESAKRKRRERENKFHRVMNEGRDKGQASIHEFLKKGKPVKSKGSSMGNFLEKDRNISENNLYDDDPASPLGDPDMSDCVDGRTDCMDDDSSKKPLREHDDEVASHSECGFMEMTKGEVRACELIYEACADSGVDDTLSDVMKKIAGNCHHALPFLLR